MRSASSSPQFDNLVAILTLAAALALTVTAANLVGEYASVEISAFNTSRNVVGYSRPRLASPDEDMVHAPLKNPPVPKTGDLSVTMSPEDAQLLKQRFEQAVSLLHAKQYDYAITALKQVIELQPKLPEAYVNIGFAYLGLEDWNTAAMAFTKATDLKADQANAYYGLALALEGREDYEGALGAMRTYIHLSTPQDPFLAKARSALWEWEEKLGRVKGPQNPPGSPQVADTQGAEPIGAE